jgi:hypothetical protein
LFAELQNEEKYWKGSAMSTYNKMKKRRDHWKREAVEAKTDRRYLRKENKRIKKERDHYQQVWRDSEKELEELKRQNKTLSVAEGGLHPSRISDAAIVCSRPYRLQGDIQSLGRHGPSARVGENTLCTNHHQLGDPTRHRQDAR